MRLALLLAAALAACGPAPADAPEADRPAETVRPEPTSSAFTVRTDSLVEADSALRYRARLPYPQIDGGPLPPAVEAVNAAVVDSVEALARSFRPEAPPPGVSVAPYPVEVEGRVGRPFLTDDLFSALVEVYAYTGGAHGNTFFLPLTFDLATGRAVRLGDLFAAGAPAGDTLAAHVDRAVARRLAAQLGTTAADARRVMYTEGLDDVRNGRVAFTLGPDSLHVHIVPYQLAAYAAGSFDVGVPYRTLRPMAAPDGPLARLGAE